MRSTHTCTHNNQTCRIEIEPLPGGNWRASIDGRAVHFRAVPIEAGWLVEIDGAQTVVHVARQGDLRHVSAGGDVWTFGTAEPARAPRRAAGASAGDLTAQMPGQVVEVLVAAGDTVQRGQTLVILEAMKMEIRVSAPAAGVVGRVLARPGDVVERGQRLLEIATGETDEP